MPVNTAKPGEKKPQQPNVGGFPSNNLTRNDADPMQNVVTPEELAASEARKNNPK